MKQLLLDVYSTETNRAVVLAPGRRFPGVVIQGDTLHGLVVRARDVAERARRFDDTELKDGADDLAEELGAVLDHYIQVLAEHDHELPFPNRS